MNIDVLSIIKVDKIKELYVKYRKNLFLCFKRIVDIVFSLFGVVLMIPIALVIKILNIIHGDFDPIFYSHERIGKNGKTFKLYKFRTMISDADEVLKEMLKDEKYKREWDLNQKFDNDPRITKVGNFLRKTSFDEFPQFLNIIKGDMSFIGPRPLLEGELDAHGGNHDIYESIRPGLTGWWACNGRSALNYNERLNLEYYYVNNLSLKLDITCIFRTIKAVFLKTGAQ